MTEQKADVDVRLLRVEEAGDYAYVQRHVFPEYNTSRLGQWFSRCFFEQYAVQDGAFGYGAWRAAQLLGFAIGCHQSAEDLVHRICFPRACWQPWSGHTCCSDPPLASGAASC